MASAIAPFEAGRQNVMPRPSSVSFAVGFGGSALASLTVPVSTIAVDRDAFVERAVAALRADPKRTWTVAALARVAGSASEFAFWKAFTRVIGMPSGVYRRIVRAQVAGGTFRATA